MAKKRANDDEQRRKREQSKNVLRGILRDWDTNRCWRSPRSEQPLLL
jgi:hypothetical protein